VAIVQISQITNRKGLQENLPQLAGAELGWSTDERRLFIGNGTLEEGAPVIGNTEILTEFSDILGFTNTYTYQGQAAGYTVDTSLYPGGPPIRLSLQSWLDQFASVLDFGAVGDGVTDNTDAINNALHQLYCVQNNPQVRRSLFFPAGVYKVSGTINIPPYATLYGEGVDNSVISLVNGGGSVPYVAQTADSRQQTGVNIATGGATPPTYITISNLGFQSVDPLSNIFLVNEATNCRFQNVGFYGPLTVQNIKDTTNTDHTIAIDFSNTCEEILFEGCEVSGVVYGVNTNQQLKGITVTNSKFTTLYQGIVLSQTSEFVGSIAGQTLTVTSLLQGSIVVGQLLNSLSLNIQPNTTVIALGTGVGGVGTYTVSIPQTVASETMTGIGDKVITGFRITGNLFDNIYAEGIIFSNVSLNASGHNIFYDVGNHLLGAGHPATSIIDIQHNNNVSISDLFERTDVDAVLHPRVNLNDTASIATTNGNQLAMGTYTRESGLQAVLINNTPGQEPVFTVNTSKTNVFSVNYSILRGPSPIYRTGTLLISANPGSGSPVWSDEYVQNQDTGIILYVAQAGANITVSYTASGSGPSSGDNALFNYSINYLV
jgi:Pectate lyase superfamily protein